MLWRGTKWFDYLLSANVTVLNSHINWRAYDKAYEHEGNAVQSTDCFNICIEYRINNGTHLINTLASRIFCQFQNLANECPKTFLRRYEVRLISICFQNHLNWGWKTGFKLYKRHFNLQAIELKYIRKWQFYKLYLCGSLMLPSWHCSGQIGHLEEAVLSCWEGILQNLWQLSNFHPVIKHQVSYTQSI